MFGTHLFLVCPPDGHLMHCCFNQSSERYILPLSIKFWILPFKTKQSSIEWLINRWYGRYFGLSVRPNSPRRFISGKVRMFSLRVLQITLSSFLDQNSALVFGVLGVKGDYPRSFVLVDFNTRPTWQLELQQGSLLHARASSSTDFKTSMSRHYTRLSHAGLSSRKATDQFYPQSLWRSFCSSSGDS